MNLVEKIEKQVYNDDKSNPYYSFSVMDIFWGLHNGDVVFSPQTKPLDLPDEDKTIRFSIDVSDLAG